MPTDAEFQWGVYADPDNTIIPAVPMDRAGATAAALQLLAGTAGGGVRALTAPELAAATALATRNTNGADLRSKATAALTANATYLALASPTVAQNTAQIRALTREVNALIRLEFGLLDTTAGT